METKKIAILGASYLQKNLLVKAKEMGFTTLCFAWENNATEKETADYFFPISIIEKEKIYEVCKEYEITGICTIGSDIGMETVQFVASKLNLVSNDLNTTLITRDKYLMRSELAKHGLNSIKYQKIKNLGEKLSINYPFMVKATDRSGSKGIQLVHSKEEFENAWKDSRDVSLKGEVIIEEYFDGEQFSVETISQNGVHHLVAITKEFYSGPPYFVEVGHYIPANLNNDQTWIIWEYTRKVLDAVGLKEGAGHVELRVNNTNEIQIIEIGSRMGGDFRDIMVKQATGYDYIENVIKCCVGESLNPPKYSPGNLKCFIRYLLKKDDINLIKTLEKNHKVVHRQLPEKMNMPVIDVKESSERFGYSVFLDDLEYEELNRYFI